MDDLTEARAFVRQAIERLQRLQHHAPAQAGPLLHAVLMNLEGNLLTLDDVAKLIQREAGR